MKLKSIHIANFRSIVDLLIEIKSIGDSCCYILLGLNEVGKSNILRAIAAPTSKNVLYKSDCEKDAQHEGKDIVVSYIYTDTQDVLKEEISKMNFPDNLKEEIIITSIERKYKVSKDDKIFDGFWLTFDKIDFNKYLVDTSKNIIYNKNDLNQPTDVDNKNIAELYDVLTSEMLDEIIESEFRDVLKNEVNEIIFWRNSPEYLINEPINILDFSKNTNISIPLKNIFSLSKLKDKALQSRISLALSSLEEREELESILSSNATEHINKLWPEHKINIKIRIEETNSCIINVEDKDRKHKNFRMGQRSDGFKHFISILLTLSIQNITHELTNKIILIDEPENSLHPSSIKYLREEILNIGKENTVILATHSIYMIDSKNLDRHFRVSKIMGATLCEQIQKDNPYEEEVIYEALGTTIYEILEPNMILFEGQIDKELFDCFTKKLYSQIKPCRIRSIFTSGANNMPKYAKFFNQKLVKGYIVVDSDSEGRGAKKNVIKENNSLVKYTYELTDLVKNTKLEMTVEDLFPKEILQSAFKNVYNIDIELNNEKMFVDQIKSFKHHMNIIEDGNLEKYKTMMLKCICKSIAKKSISKINEEYPLYTEFIRSIHSNIKSK